MKYLRMMLCFASVYLFAFGQVGCGFPTKTELQGEPEKKEKNVFLPKCIAPKINRSNNAPFYKWGVYQIDEEVKSVSPRYPRCPSIQLPQADENKLTDKTKERYRLDALFLSTRYMHESKDFSIQVPACLTQLFYRALIHIYNSQGICRDVVVNRYKIHIYAAGTALGIKLSLDSDLPWVRNLKEGQQRTGNQELDRIMDKYQMTIAHFYKSSSSLSSTIVLKLPYGLNNRNLGKKLEPISGVKNVGTVGVVGDGDRVDVKIKKEGVIVEFSKGYGDCPMGCTQRYRVRFRVNLKGSVDVLGNSGIEPHDWHKSQNQSSHLP